MRDNNHSFALIVLEIPISPWNISLRAKALAIFGLISIALKSLEVCDYISIIHLGTNYTLETEMVLHLARR